MWLATAERAEQTRADNIFAAPGCESRETSEETLFGTNVVALELVGATAVTAGDIVLIDGILAWKVAREGDAPRVGCSDERVKALRDERYRR